MFATAAGTAKCLFFVPFLALALADAYLQLAFLCLRQAGDETNLPRSGGHWARRPAWAALKGSVRGPVWILQSRAGGVPSSTRWQCGCAVQAPPTFPIRHGACLDNLPSQGHTHVLTGGSLDLRGVQAGRLEQRPSLNLNWPLARIAASRLSTLRYTQTDVHEWYTRNGTPPTIRVAIHGKWHPDAK